MIRGDNAATRNLETIHNDKTARRNNLRMRVKSDRPPHFQREFRNFVATNEDLLLLSGNGFQGGGVNYSFDRIYFALDLLSSELEFIRQPLFERLPAEPEEPSLETGQFIGGTG